MAKTSEVAVLGAGPYGLAATAYLRDAGADVRTFGDPMSFWRSMPAGMLLRSNRTATSMIDHAGPHSIQAHAADTDRPIKMPYPLERFVDYGMWVQRRVAPDVERRDVRRVDADAEGFRLELDDGEAVFARRVVIAGGIGAFPRRPAVATALGPDQASHTADHRDLSAFAGRSVLVVGGGQSALESAALLREAGADPQVIVRADAINWLHGGKYHRMLGKYSTLVYAPTDVGPLGLSRLVGATDLFRRLPRAVSEPIARRSIRPAGAAWLRPRLTDVPIDFGLQVEALREAPGGVHVDLTNGSVRRVDHVLFGTGYAVDVARYPFLAEALLSRIRRVQGYPVLSQGLESSVPGLHFLGAPAAWSFGPTMRFVSGSWYAGRAVAAAATGSGRATRTAERVSPH